jgi:hypothetical protein
VCENIYLQRCSMRDGIRCLVWSGIWILKATLLRGHCASTQACSQVAGQPQYAFGTGMAQDRQLGTDISVPAMACRMALLDRSPVYLCKHTSDLACTSPLIRWEAARHHCMPSPSDAQNCNCASEVRIDYMCALRSAVICRNEGLQHESARHSIVPPVRVCAR